MFPLPVAVGILCAAVGVGIGYWSRGYAESQRVPAASGGPPRGMPGAPGGGGMMGGMGGGGFGGGGGWGGGGGGFSGGGGSFGGGGAGGSW